MASTLHISLTEPLMDFVDAQTEAGDFASPDQYIGDLIQQAADRQQRIEELLLESLNDPRECLIISAEDWQHGDIAALILEHAKKLA
jgi:Arc/MetJ-type ribon-helix-helix transcriptional regulator